MQFRTLKRPRSALVAPIAAALMVVATATAATAAPSGSTTTLYASPNGTGSTCAAFRPCSLSSAQNQARAASSRGANVSVLLAGGTYQLASPLTLTSADSGLSGRRVTYQAMSGQTPVFSGGRTITGWKPYDASRNIWVASAPGIAATRQLYVNGTRASLASAPVSAVFGSLTPTGSGYQTSQVLSLAPWSNSADQPDLLYIGTPFSWATSLCGITAASASALTMANPCFENLMTPLPWYTTSSASLSHAAYVENNLSLLTQPGQFYVSTATGQIYYIPRAGEAMNSVNVVAPQLTSLVTATNVSNVTISGVTFSFATWLPDAAQGMMDFQSNVYTTTSNSAWAIIPSAVAVSGSHNLVFSGNTLIHLGGGGVSFDAGGTSNTISGNVVTDASSTGISISSPLSAAESYDQVTNNYVHHVSVEYRGGVGIFAGEPEHTTIAHNEVWGLPGNGISLGWGWGPTPSMTDNHIDYNRIHDINESAMYDGGAIYLNGGENGTAQNSSVIGNYISGDPQPYGAIFLEAGASNYNVSSNVVLNTTTNWIYLQSSAYGSPAVNNTISNNYTNAGTLSLCLTVSASCTVATTIDPSNVLTNNTTVSSLTSAVNTLLSTAGIQSSYASITGGPVGTNLSYGTPATGSSTDGSSWSPSGANDGNSWSSWTSAAGDASALWQTDLGSARTLTDVQALTNETTDVPGSRSNVTIVVSNSPITAANPGTTVCSIGSPGLAFQDVIDCAAPSGTWRYVGFSATAGQQLSLAEVRVFGY